MSKKTLLEWISLDRPLHEKLVVLQNIYCRLQEQSNNKNMKPISSQIIITENLDAIFPTAPSIKGANTPEFEQQALIYKHSQYPIWTAMNIFVLMINRGQLINARDYLKNLVNKQLKSSNIHQFIENSLAEYNKSFKQYNPRLSRLIQQCRNMYNSQQPAFQKNQNLNTSNPNNTNNRASTINNNQRSDQFICKLQSYIDKKQINHGLKYIQSYDSNNDWRIINAKGVFYQYINNYASANEQYLAAKGLSKNQKLVLNNLASLLYIQNKDHEYRNILNDLQKNCTNQNDHLILLQYQGDSLIKNQLYSKAQQIYNRLNKLNENNKNNYLFKSIYYRIKIAETYLLSKRYEDARNKLNQINKSLDDYLRQLEFQKKNLEKGFRTSTLISSKNQSIPTGVNTNQQLGQYNKIIDTLLQWKQIVSLNLVLVQKQLKPQSNYKESIENIYKSNHQALWNIRVYADFLLEHKYYQQAKNKYLEIRQAFENDYDYFWNLGKCFYELQMKQCIIYFNKCKIINPAKTKFINNTIATINQYLNSLDNSIKSTFRKSTVLGTTEQREIEAILKQIKNGN